MNETALKSIRDKDKKKADRVLRIEKDQDFPRFSEWIKFGKSVLGFNGLRVRSAFKWNDVVVINVHRGADPGLVEYLSPKGKVLYSLKSQSFLNGETSA